MLPSDSLAGLTSEDLRLILNGAETISIRLFESFTTWLDESSSDAETISRYKRWFYSVLNKFSEAEKQVRRPASSASAGRRARQWATSYRQAPPSFQQFHYFLSGSPAMPSSEEAFAPLPTIMLRPADDEYLPTVRRCSRRFKISCIE